MLKSLEAALLPVSLTPLKGNHYVPELSRGDRMSGQGGKREGAGRPESCFSRTSFTMRLSDITVERVERFAQARGLNRTQALEALVEEYVLVLDGIMLPGRWRSETFRRPGLKSIVAAEIARKASLRAQRNL